MTVSIIGAGVAGLTTALALAERGEKVEVLEASTQLGAASCSRFAGGMLAPWCERESAEELVLTLGGESIAYWSRILPDACKNGTLVLVRARDDAGLDRFARRTTSHEVVMGDEIGGLEPCLAGRFRRGLFFAREAHINPRLALPALAAKLAALNVPIHFGTDGASASRGARIVDCRGLLARDTLADLRGVKGEMLIVRCPDISLSRPVRLLHSRIPFYVVPRGDGIFMLGATMIESDDRTRVTARAVMDLLDSAQALHPAFADAEILEIGTEARPAFPDNLPRIRRVGGRLYVNGLYRHGFLLAPAVARMAASVLLDNQHFPGVMDESDDQRHCA